MPAPTKAKLIDLEQPGAKPLTKAEAKRRSSALWRDAPAQIPVPAKRKYTKDELKGDIQYLSQRVTTFLLEGDRLEKLMSVSTLKDIMVTMGIATEKLLLLEGQPTAIISQQQHQKIDEVLPALMAEMKRRGVKADLTERKVSLTLPEQA